MLKFKPKDYIQDEFVATTSWGWEIEVWKCNGKWSVDMFPPEDLAFAISIDQVPKRSYATKASAIRGADRWIKRLGLSY